MTTTGTARDAREIPRASGSRLALMRALRNDPMSTFSRLRREHGPIVAISMPGLRVYLVSDPAAVQDGLTLTGRTYVKGVPGRARPRPDSADASREGIQPLSRILGQGLLTSAGELWRHQRRLIQPLFHQARVNSYGATFARLAEHIGNGWRDGEQRDMHLEMTELTLAIVARTVFDVDLDAQLVADIRRSLTTNLSTARRAVVPLGRFADRLPLPSTRRFNADKARLDRQVHEMIAQRRATGNDGTDLLSLLLSARDEDTGEPMPDDQVRDEAVTILLAGHETTANALAFALHLLGENPKAQEELAAELDQVLDGRLPGVDDVRRLPYTTAVLHESMRLYPPAWVLARRLLAPREVCGYLLPAGSLCAYSAWVIHRDPALWPEPERFLPRRWLDGDVDRHRYAYFPFGGGPRQCIGNTFAELEAILVLATLCRRWRVAPVPGAEVRPRAMITLRPRTGVPMTVHRR
jgi:cytochrome P450